MRKKGVGVTSIVKTSISEVKVKLPFVIFYADYYTYKSANSLQIVVKIINSILDQKMNDIRRSQRLLDALRQIFLKEPILFEIFPKCKALLNFTEIKEESYKFIEQKNKIINLFLFIIKFIPTCLILDYIGF